MTHPLKARMKKRYEAVEARVLDDTGWDEAQADDSLNAHQKITRATVVWWTKSTGQVVRNGTLLKEFRTQDDLIKWMEKTHEQLISKDVD